MGWIAGRTLRVQRGDKVVLVLRGEPVPEAEHWRKRERFRREGRIVFVDDSTSAPSPLAAPHAQPARIRPLVKAEPPKAEPQEEPMRDDKAEAPKKKKIKRPPKPRKPSKPRAP